MNSQAIPASPRAFPWLALALAVQWVFSIGAFFYLGRCFTSSDEYCRLYYSMNWSREAFFAPEDHVWLGGHFWLLGSLIKLWGDPVTMAVAWGLLSGTVAVTACWLLGRDLGAGNRGAGLAALLVATLPVMAALGRSSLPDLLTMGLLLGAVICCLRHFRKFPSEPWQVSSYWIAGTVLVMIAQTMRYEGWFFTVSWGLMTVYLGVRAGMARAGGQVGVWALLGACLLIFPAAWAMASWHSLGSPMAFAENLRAYAKRPTPHLDLEVMWQRSLYYLLYTVWQIPILSAVGVIGLVSVLRRGVRHELAGLVHLLSLWVVMQILVTVSGTGNSWPFRYPLPFVMPLALFSYFGFAAIVGRFRNRKAGYWAVGILLFLTLGWNLRPVDHPEHSKKVEFARFVMMEERIRRQWALIGNHLYSVRPRDGSEPVDVLAYNPEHVFIVPIHHWALSTHAGPRYRVRTMTSKDEWLAAVETWDVDLFVFGDPDNDPPEGLVELESQRSIILLARPDAAGRYAGGME